MSECGICYMWLCGSNCRKKSHFSYSSSHLLVHVLVNVGSSDQGRSKVESPRAGYVEVGALRAAVA